MSVLKVASLTAAALLLLLALAGPAFAAGQRVALVIGNGSYAHAPALANPLNDAADMGGALERLGFEVTRIENADYSETLRRGLHAVQAGRRRCRMMAVRSSTLATASRWTGATSSSPSTHACRAMTDVEFETVPLESGHRGR